MGRSKNHKRAFHSIALFPDNGYAKAAHAIRGVPMSALGQERISRIVERMPALPPKADISRACWDVRFVPIADMTLPPNCVIDVA